jgi:hypothetical protein
MVPTYNICSCCGVEAGYEDCMPEGVRRYRDKWIADGAKWCVPKFKPDRWNLDLQLMRAPGAPAAST